MIDGNQIIRRADQEGIPATTVERDYVLAHVMHAVAACDQGRCLVFKGGTALRLCFFEDYRYSADLDFSIVGGASDDGVLSLVRKALERCRASTGLSSLQLDVRSGSPRILYEGPLGRQRSLKLDLALDELVEETVSMRMIQRYPDQDAAAECAVYTLEETAAEKLRCVIQRLQCRDLFDLHALLVRHEIDADVVWPRFERKARHRHIDPALFARRLDQRARQYEQRWEAELGEHIQHDLPHFKATLRGVRRALRSRLRG